jgi:hypothetical protein
MCGLPTIDVEDLKANTEYSGYTRDSVQIRESTTICVCVVYICLRKIWVTCAILCGLASL